MASEYEEGRAHGDRSSVTLANGTTQTTRIQVPAIGMWNFSSIETNTQPGNQSLTVCFVFAFLTNPLLRWWQKWAIFLALVFFLSQFGRPMLYAVIGGGDSCASSF